MLNWKQAPIVGAAFAVIFVVGTTTVSMAEEGNEAFELLSDDVKAIVLETNKQMGDLDRICELERTARLSEINQVIADLRASGKFTGVGFFSLDVGNYYNRRCRDRS